MYANGKGILQTSVAFLLEKLQSSVLYISMVELYNQQFSDLLSSTNSKLNINCTGKTIVTGSKKQQISMLSELEGVIESALAKRTTKSTNQNISSSRSHAFTIIEKENGGNQLVLADFAGFESSENKENMNESIGINAALSHFNKVLLDLRQKRTPSYVSNRLTQFLQPVLKQSKPIVYYHFSLPNIVKYLNLVEHLMGARVSKRPPSNETGNNSKKVKNLRN